MAVVDHNYRFVIADVGAFGSESDGGVFAQTSFGQAIVNETVCETMRVPQDRTIPDVEGPVPFYLVGDDAFPLKRYLLKPFAGRNLPELEATFNYRLSRARRIVENAFGILAARWRIFRTCIIGAPEKIERYALACICLHNYIMDREQKTFKRYNPPGYADMEDEDGTVIMGAYHQEITDFSPMSQLGSHNAKRAAFEVRQKLAQYFMNEGQLPWQAAYIRRGRRH